MSSKPFWEDLKIPYQEQEEGFDFANPVVVAQHFVKMIGVASYLGEQAEVLTEQLANLTIKKERKERELKKLRRSLLAKSYDGITKSASSEIQEAYIWKIAQEAGKDAEMTLLEDEIDSLTRDIEIREPRVAQFRSRLKLLENTLNWGKQFLDFDKLIIRASNSGN